MLRDGMISYQLDQKLTIRKDSISFLETTLKQAYSINQLMILDQLLMVSMAKIMEMRNLPTLMLNSNNNNEKQEYL